MTKLLYDFAEWAIQSGALVAFFVFLWKYLKPVLNEKASHASSEQSKVVLTMIDQLADNAVSSLVSADFSGAKKFSDAVQIVLDGMKKQGYNVSEETVKTAVQAAYEKSPLTPTVNQTTANGETPAVVDNVNNTQPVAVDKESQVIK